MQVGLGQLRKECHGKEKEWGNWRLRSLKKSFHFILPSCTSALPRSSDDIFHDSINSRKPHPGKLSLVPSSAGQAGKGQCSTHNSGILLTSPHSDPGWLRCAENSSASFLVQNKPRKGAWLMLRSLHGLPKPIFSSWVHPAPWLHVLEPQMDLWYSG